MAKRSLFWRLFPTYIAITLLALAAVFWYTRRLLDSFQRSSTQVSLSARARLLEPQFRALVAAGEASAVDAACKRLGPPSGTRITVILPSGKVIGDSDEDPAQMANHATDSRPEMVSALAREEGIATRRSATLQQDMMYFAIPLLRNGNVVGVLRTSIPVASIEAATRAVSQDLVVGGLAVAALAALVSLAVARRISRPLEQLRQGAERFTQGDLHVRLPAFNTAEFDSVADAMNQMAAQIDRELQTILRQRNEQQAILASMMEGLVAVGNDERLISINGAATRMLGIEHDAPQGRTIQEVIRNTATREFVARALSEEGPVEAEIAIGESDARILQAHGTALRDASGERFGAVVVLNDITRLRRLENLRREFVANVSHELRTPITSIRGFIETLLDGAIHDPEDAERFLGITSKQVERLSAIIEDLLLLSRLEPDTSAEIPLQACRLRAVLEAAVELCSARAAEKSIAMHVNCNEALTVRVSRALLEQAVVNLLDNAINYSNADSRVDVVVEADEREIRIRVCDEGCGIGPEHLPRLFERFYRVDKARSRKLGGTGLGLAIVKHIAQAHGGRVSVESKVGEGSTFTIHLPRES